MKNILPVFLTALSATIVQAQSAPEQSVTLSLDQSHSVFFDRKLKASADSALKIATAVLNSQEFRDGFKDLSFPCMNYGNKRCKSNPISAQTIMDSLYSHAKVSLTLILNDCGGGTFGMSSYGIPKVTSCYETVNDDDDHLPFAYKYAYHICHEYMHIVGFYHFRAPKHRVIKQDIAEDTGWIAFYILEKWYNNHRQIPGL